MGQLIVPDFAGNGKATVVLDDDADEVVTDDEPRVAHYVRRLPRTLGFSPFRDPLEAQTIARLLHEHGGIWDELRLARVTLQLKRLTKRHGPITGWDRLLTQCRADVLEKIVIAITAAYDFAEFEARRSSTQEQRMNRRRLIVAFIES